MSTPMGKLGAIIVSLRAGSDLRRSGRVAMESTLSCNLGIVRDCSIGGLRIRSRLAIRETLVLVRLWDERGGFECEAQVMWRARKGFFCHETGLLLPPLEDRDRAQLVRLACVHRDHLIRTRQAA